jgi:hypothetical protein
MIRKTAIVQALREAFPEDLGALYTEEEQTTPINDVAYEVKEEIKTKANTKVIDIQPEHQNTSNPEKIKNSKSENTKIQQQNNEGPGF